MAKGDPPDSSIGARIRRRLLELGISQSELARRAGVSQSVINDLINGRQDKTRFVPEIAAGLHWTPGELDPRFEDPARAAVRMLGGLEAAEPLPVFSAVEAGPGFLVVSTDPVKLIPRPSEVQHVRDAYGLIVTGESMAPRYKPGELVICHPRLPAVNGKDFVFATDPEDSGEFRATLKELVGQTNTEWHVLQLNGEGGVPERKTLAKAEWPKCVRVVGRWD